MSDYDTDLVLWADDQARALRAAASAGANLPIDWDNVAEEIDELGKSQRRDLASRIATILIHLLKLEASPATAPVPAGVKAFANSGTPLTDYWAIRRVCVRPSLTWSRTNCRGQGSGCWPLSRTIPSSRVWTSMA